MTRVLVTGGTGVLGREVVSRLLEKGYTVRVAKITWAQWLHRRYSHARQTGEKIGPVYLLRG